MKRKLLPSILLAFISGIGVGAGVVTAVTSHAAHTNNKNHHSYTATTKTHYQSYDSQPTMTTNQIHYKNRANTTNNNKSSKETSIVARQLSEKKVVSSPFGIVLFKPNYILPFYYTGSPYYRIYNGNTPDDQKVQNLEFKFQISLMIPVWDHMFGTKNSLNIAYTQLSYWQLYTRSPYFRETNYEPQIFISHPINNNWHVDLGAVHQSNGRGGTFERSWNRVYANIIYSGANWMVSIKPWALIFQGSSSDLHNPDITSYLGHARLLLAYKWRHQEFSLMSRNNLESGFKRGAVQFTWSFPLYHRLRGYVQLFSGYGQSLIEYDHYTASAGAGIAFNDWI